MEEILKRNLVWVDEKIDSEDVDLKNLHIKNTRDNIIQKYKTMFKL